MSAVYLHTTVLLLVEDLVEMEGLTGVSELQQHTLKVRGNYWHCNWEFLLQVEPQQYLACGTQNDCATPKWKHTHIYYWIVHVIVQQFYDIESFCVFDKMANLSLDSSLT